ncbi:MAG: RDD family protein [Taibaiella sp.]|nr:RDD family protein [Taibaiella sp.]
MKRNTIITLSFIFALAGICSGFWFMYGANKVLMWTMYILSFCTPYGFTHIFEDFTLEWNGYSYPFNLINLYFYLSFFAGTLAYACSKGRETRLLRFNYSVIILGHLIGLPFIIARFFFHENNSGMKAPDFNPVMYFIQVLIFCLTFFIAYRVLVFFRKKSNLEISIEPDIDGKEQEYLLPATKGQRFINYLVDDILISLYLITIIKNLVYNYTFSDSFHNTWLSALGNKFTLIVMVLMARFVYFFIFEALFASTPGKMLTQTRVSDKNGHKAGLESILRRTLSRFIPFETLTFLTGYNLHDKLSDTYVIREEQKGVSSGIYLGIMLPVFLSIIIFHIIYNYIN